MQATPIGSCDGEIRLWKVDVKLRCLSATGILPCPGVVNSLQITSPSALFDDAVWIKKSEHAAGHRELKGRGVRGVVIVAGVGKEPRMGRWFKAEDCHVANCTVVVALSSRGDQ